MKPQTKTTVSKKKKYTGLKVFVTLFIILIITLATLPFFINPIAESLVKQQIAALFGNNLTIGSVNVSLWTGATVNIHQIELKQPSNYKKGYLVKAEDIKARIALIPLLKKQLLIHNITLIRPEINIIQKKNGEQNINYYLDKLKSKPANPNRSLTARLNLFGIKQGKITLNSYAISGNYQPTFLLTDCDLIMRDIYLPNPNKNATKFRFNGNLGKERPAPIKINGSGIFGTNNLCFSLKSNIDKLTLADYSYMVPNSSFNVKSGKALITSDARCNNNYLRSYHHVDIKDLKLAPKKGHKVSGTLLGLTGNMLLKFIQDRNGVFDIEFTVSGPLDELKTNMKLHIMRAVNKSISSKLGISKMGSGIQKVGRKIGNPIKKLFKKKKI